jgi:hypothetical protein
MGQQQLLLLVLGIVIVGIAIVLSITAFTTNSAKANADALMQDAVRIATDAQLWKKRPEIMGGSPDEQKSNPADFRDLDYTKLGYSANLIVDQDCYRTQNGEFALFAEQDFVGVLATNVLNRNMVGVIVTGGRSEDIQLYGDDWNPVVAGAGADGRRITVESHQRCKGRGQTPLHADPS